MDRHPSSVIRLTSPRPRQPDLSPPPDSQRRLSLEESVESCRPRDVKTETCRGPMSIFQEDQHRPEQGLRSRPQAVDRRNTGARPEVQPAKGFSATRLFDRRRRISGVILRLGSRSSPASDWPFDSKSDASGSSLAMHSATAGARHGDAGKKFVAVPAFTLAHLAFAGKASMTYRSAWSTRQRSPQPSRLHCRAVPPTEPCSTYSDRRRISAASAEHPRTHRTDGSRCATVPPDHQLNCCGV